MLYDAVVKAVLQVANLRRGVDVNDFERALARFMAQHLAPGSQPDAAMYDAASPLFERAQAAGEVRADTNLDDVLRLVSGVTASHYESDEQRARVLALALDAVRTPPAAR